VLFDGAMGTALQAAGLGASELPEIWNVTHPDVVSDIHLGYLRAGSDVVTTNTLGALQNVLDESGCGYSTEEVYAAAVSCARSAIETIQKEESDETPDKPRFVAASIGPTRHLVGMTGGINAEEAYELYKAAVMAAERAGADVLLFETFTDILELKTGILAAKEYTNLPVFACLTYEKGGRTLTGTDPFTAINITNGLGLDAFGVNCSLGPDALLDIAKELADYSGVPVIVQPNAGMPTVLDDGSLVYDMDAEDFADKLIEIAKSGAAIIGGCCGSNYTFISAVRKRLDAAHDDEPTVFPAVATQWFEEKAAKGRPSVCSGAKTIFADDIDMNELPRGVATCVDADVISEAQDGNFKLSDGRKALLHQTTTPENLDMAMRACRGKPGICMGKSEPGKEEQIRAVAKKYGAVVLE